MNSRLIVGTIFPVQMSLMSMEASRKWLVAKSTAVFNSGRAASALKLSVEVKSGEIESASSCAEA